MSIQKLLADTGGVLPGELSDIAITTNELSDIGTVFKYGMRPDLDQSVWHSVWTASGGADYSFLTTAEPLKAFSTSSNDNAGGAGTGAYNLKIDGLDVDYNPITEVLSLTGATPVVGAKEFFRVNRAYVITAAGSESNIGDITVAGNSSSNVLAYILADEGQTQQCIYTVPAGKTLFMANWYGTLNRGSAAGTDVDFQLRIFTPNTGANDRVRLVKMELGVKDRGNSHFDHNFGIPRDFIADRTTDADVPEKVVYGGEKTDIVVAAYSNQNNARVVAGFAGYLLGNPE